MHWCFSSSVCSVGDQSSVVDEVNEVMSGLSPSDLPDIESDNEFNEQEEATGASAAAGASDDDDDSNDSDDGEDTGSVSSSAAIRGATAKITKKDRHFWQYNVQAKGPKGQKIVVPTKIEDPHVLNDIVDPVFSDDIQLQGIKHRCDLLSHLFHANFAYTE